ncbi:hypothetical protein [Variovorax sp. SRS16]|uniref:hypothetical protein n=1 Tax=Variovorax sp. SRS16 TaxID=282217 RepID=UPI001E386FD2|nr:hypothetical protein [Variovorax sp. SRS16]
MKPEAKRNEEKRRRARARTHGKYKAVGVNLIPKGCIAQALVPQQWPSGMSPEQSRFSPADQESATGTPHGVEAADVMASAAWR